MKEKILSALKNVIDPDYKKDLVTLKMIRDLKIEGKKVSFTIVLTTPACPLRNKFRDECIRFIHQEVDKDIQVDIQFSSNVTYQQRANSEILKDVKNLVAVASGKGGVGKSTVALNLAISLAEFGAKVGLLDADISGPSLTSMLGLLETKPVVLAEGDRNIMVPVTKYGIKIMSIGMLVAVNQPLVWRGPMISNALSQLMIDTKWEELDYLIIDLPPGTGDIHLTLCQQMPLTSALMVTTPQLVAVNDTIKTLEMFLMDKINIPVLGIVENMSWFTPKELPESKYYIFGKDGGKKLAEQYKLPLLAQLPLVMGIADKADRGIPAIYDETDSIMKTAFRTMAENVAQNISFVGINTKH